MNKVISNLLKKKGKRLFNIKYSNIQLIKKIKNGHFFCIIKYEGNYEIYYLLKNMIIKNKYLSKSILVENMIDQSSLKLKLYAPNLIIFTLI